MNSTKEGKRFVAQRVVSDNFLLLASMYINNPDWVTELEKRDFLTYQIVTTNLNALFTGIIGRKFALSSWSFKGEILGRWIMVTASNKTQSVVGSFILNSDVELGSGAARARSIEFANHIWNIPMLLKSFYIDRLLIKKSPLWSYNLCLKNSSLSYLVSPGMMTLIDRSATWLLYLGYIRWTTGE